MHAYQLQAHTCGLQMFLRDLHPHLRPLIWLAEFPIRQIRKFDPAAPIFDPTHYHFDPDFPDLPSPLQQHAEIVGKNSFSLHSLIP